MTKKMQWRGKELKTVNTLTQCPTCGREISVNAYLCPGCGERNVYRVSAATHLGNFFKGIGLLALVILVVFCARCASTASAQERERQFAPLNQPAPQPTTEWIAYKGPQHFLTVPDSKVLLEFPLPVYLGYPDKNYEILGHVVVRNAPDKTPPKREAAIRSAAVAAKLHGGQAIYLLPLTERNPRVFMAAVAVKWK